MLPPSGTAAPAADDPESGLPLLGGPLGAFACFMPLFALLFWPLRPPATSLFPPLPCVMAAMAVQVPRSVTYSTLVTPGLPHAVLGPVAAHALSNAAETV